jgi:hypothetical protein
MELTDRRDGNERVLHWINYKAGAAVDPVQVVVALPDGKKAKRVEWISPDMPSETMEFQEDRRGIRLRLPRTETYGFAAILL